MNDSYRIREVFSTLQGEGARTGAKSIFLRFSGCNLWDGHPEHRARGKGACAAWCDTDFAKGEVMTSAEIRAKLNELWPEDNDRTPRWVVISGGEPMLQLDLALIQVLHTDHWRIAVETNGTIESDLYQHLDWVCCSPKLGALETKLRVADEVKVVLPGGPDGGWTDQALLDLEMAIRAEHHYLQPQDPIDPGFVQVSALHGDLKGAPEIEYMQNLQRCIDFIMQHPRWRLSLQAHKLARLP